MGRDFQDEIPANPTKTMKTAVAKNTLKNSPYTVNLIYKYIAIRCILYKSFFKTFLTKALYKILTILLGLCFAREPFNEQEKFMIWAITREPDDRMADVRVSLGKKSDIGCYLVFRGDPEEVVKLLEESLSEARRTLPRGDYTDHRGRPQG
jgi:hypothetical protein